MGRLGNGPIFQRAEISITGVSRFTTARGKNNEGYHKLDSSQPTGCFIPAGRFGFRLQFTKIQLKLNTRHMLFSYRLSTQRSWS